MKVAKIFFLLAALIINFSLEAQSNETSTVSSNENSESSNPFSPLIESWPAEFLARIGQEVGEEWDDAGQRLSASIFESLTDQEILSIELGSDATFKLQIKRRTFDNHDILDSWTVADIFRVPVYLPITLGNPSVSVGSGTFGLKLGLNLGLNAVHIRQVVPRNFHLLPSLKELEEKAKEAQELGEREDTYEEGDYQIVTAEEGEPSILNRVIETLPWATQNPQTTARYNKLWNLLIHPFKLPLTANRLKKMAPGEIVSYSADGTIELGGSVGWSGLNIGNLAIDNTSSGLGLTTYLTGRHKISVWKESQDHAQVKLTRSRERGSNAALGSTGRHEIFRGFVVFKATVGRISKPVIPFSLAVNPNYTKQFDVGYRYDLKNPKALRAYQEAVRGRFKFSEELTFQSDSGVAKSFDRQQDIHSQNRQYKMQLSLFFERAHLNSRSHRTAVITLDGKQHYIFKAINRNYRAYDTLWGNREAHSHTFTTTIDRDHYLNNGKGLAMTIEGRIEDSHTNGKEINTYMDEVEMATGTHGLFKRPPLLIPESENQRNNDENNSSNPPPHARYGKTSFYYQVGITRNLVEKFIHYPPEKMWPALEVAFGIKKGRWNNSWRRFIHTGANSYATLLNIPLALLNVNLKNGGKLILARKFHRRWKTLRKIEKPEELSKVIAELFQTVNHNISLVKLVREVLEGEELAYFITAKANKLFGQISQSGKNIDEIDTISYQANRRISWDRIGPRNLTDPKANIRNLEIEVEDSDTIKISFLLPATPQYLYAKVDQTPRWSQRNLLKLVITNKGTFTKGWNTVRIKRVDGQATAQGWRQHLAKALFNGRATTFSLSASLKDHQWGSIISKRFLSPQNLNNQN